MSVQSQPREKIHAWIKGFHQAADSLTTDKLPNFYTKDATLQFANNDLFVGLDSIIGLFNNSFPNFKSMKHEIVRFDVIANTIYMTGTVTYVVKNDPENLAMKIPAMGVFHIIEEGVVDVERGEAVLEKFEVYLDASRVFTRVAEVQGKGKGN